MQVKVEIYQFSANATPIAPALAATDSTTTSDLVTNGIKSLQHLVMTSPAALGLAIEFLNTYCCRMCTLWTSRVLQLNSNPDSFGAEVSKHNIQESNEYTDKRDKNIKAVHLNNWNDFFCFFCIIWNQIFFFSIRISCYLHHPPGNEEIFVFGFWNKVNIILLFILLIFIY